VKAGAQTPGTISPASTLKPGDVDPTTGGVVNDDGTITVTNPSTGATTVLPAPSVGVVTPAGGSDTTIVADGDDQSVILDPEAPPAVTPPGCGDGVLTSDEACDDHNLLPDDGCAADCLSVTPGFSCAAPGEACRQIARCGDGLVADSEQCDDQNTADGDGCSARCRIEFGKKCEGAPSVCTDAVCGDGKREGAESCDDGNTEPFDGCSSLCLKEPNCQGTSCTSDCGDGLLINEDCDDGNKTSGDGCSADCKIENGFTCDTKATCEKIDGECVLRVPAIFRDFSGDRSDFGDIACSALTPGIVQDDLDADGRPAPAAIDKGCIDSEDKFKQWYRNGDYAVTVISNIILFDNGNGGYVNRFGHQGDGAANIQYTTTAPNSEKGGSAATEAGCEANCSQTAENTTQCSNGNACNPLKADIDSANRALEQAQNNADTTEDELTALQTAVDDAQAAFDDCGTTCKANTDELTQTCADTCAPCSYDPKQWCSGGTKVSFDGNPLFFPVDSIKTGPTVDLFEAQLPDEYGHTGWPKEAEVFGGAAVMHNFYFTSEVQYWFHYNEDTNATLDFLGDDDMWVFINGKLALDLGGVHTPEAGTVTINAASAARFGLQTGNVYKISVFHAEREAPGSSFKLTLSGFEATPSDCSAVCGDGILSFGEECDDGVNDGGYGECDVGCKLGAFCGDGIVNGEEDCDRGPNGGQGCPGCRILTTRVR
jgi:fibro-slime domain-containing protein